MKMSISLTLEKLPCIKWTFKINILIHQKVESKADAKKISDLRSSQLIYHRNQVLVFFFVS